MTEKDYRDKRCCFWLGLQHHSALRLTAHHSLASLRRPIERIDFGRTPVSRLSRSVSSESFDVKEGQP